MKTYNAKKVVVSVLALAMGAGIAGSISGSIAWYQYSTRVSAVISGASAGTVRELQVSKTADGQYSQHVSFDNQTFKPTSVSVGNNNALTFYRHPVYKTANLGVLNDTAGYVADYTFYFKCVDNDSGTETQKAKDVYLTSIAIVDKSVSPDTLNIAPAIRVAVNGELLSINGGTTTTHGNLNLNGNKDNQSQDIMDRDGYDTNDVEGELVDYINGTSQSYTTTKVANSVTVVDSSDPYAFATKDHTELSTKKLTSTKTEGASDAVTIKVWLEGWEVLGGSSVWSEEWFNQNFEIQLQFACEADK